MARKMRGQNQGNDSQHAQKEVHGLVRAMLHPYHSQHGDIPHHSYQVHGVKADGEPDMQTPVLKCQ